MMGNKTPKEWLETGQSCMLIKRADGAVNQTKCNNYYLRCLGRKLETRPRCVTTLNDDCKLSLQRKVETFAKFV